MFTILKEARKLERYLMLNDQAAMLYILLRQLGIAEMPSVGYVGRRLLFIAAKLSIRKGKRYRKLTIGSLIFSAIDFCALECFSRL